MPSVQRSGTRGGCGHNDETFGPFDLGVRRLLRAACRGECLFEFVKDLHFDIDNGSIGVIVNIVERFANVNVNNCFASNFGNVVVAPIIGRERCFTI